MLLDRPWFGAPRRIRLIFVGMTLLLSATLGWLGWKLLRQDEQLVRQRLIERRESSALQAASALGNRLSATAQELTVLLATGQPPSIPGESDAAVIALIGPSAITAWPADHLLYVPELPDPPIISDALFRVADELEFTRRDYFAAIDALRSLAESPAGAVRAEALARTARCRLNAGETQNALLTYERLIALGSVPLAGMPAALAGRLGALAVYKSQNDRVQLAAMSRTIVEELRLARWPITSATYEYVRDQTAPWLDASERAPTPREALSAAVEQIGTVRRDGASAPDGRMIVHTPYGPVLLIWHRSTDRLAVFAAHPAFIRTRWVAPLGVKLALVATDGSPVLADDRIDSARPAIQLASSTGLPWTIEVFDEGNPAEVAGFRSRRHLFILAFLLVTVVLLTGGWFVGRSVARELAVARLQSDFVSAVSHEFRTPLTTLVQLSELLMRGRVASGADQQKYYALLHRESDRLRRLVESLLNFGRLESGRTQYRFETVDIGVLVRELAADFERSDSARNHRLDFELGAGAVHARADREALRCVLWNLLENGAKYSPGAQVVRISVEGDNRQVQIAVHDEGMGIPRGEQRRIFQKFVRGTAASDGQIRGTGIGLTIAQEIVHGHNGSITVDSEPGRGSTFRVFLPAIEPASSSEPAA